MPSVKKFGSKCSLTYSFLSPLFRIADAEENLGESEVREAHLAKALYFIRISDKVCESMSKLIVMHFCSSLAIKYLLYDPRRKLWSS